MYTSSDSENLKVAQQRGTVACRDKGTAATRHLIARWCEKRRICPARMTVSPCIYAQSLWSSDLPGKKVQLPFT